MTRPQTNKGEKAAAQKGSRKSAKRFKSEFRKAHRELREHIEDLEASAREAGVSSRQIRRIFHTDRPDFTGKSARSLDQAFKWAYRAANLLIEWGDYG